MTKVKLLDYEDVLGTLDDFKTRHVLLGNGFSRACRDELFAYNALYEQAKALGLSKKLQNVFGALATTDFEAVMKALRQSAILAETVGKDLGGFAKELRVHADELRELLVKTIAGNHPARPHDIKKEEYEACRKFLKPFGKIYTLITICFSIGLQCRTNSCRRFRQMTGLGSRTTGPKNMSRGVLRTPISRIRFTSMALCICSMPVTSFRSTPGATPALR